MNENGILLVIMWLVCAFAAGAVAHRKGYSQWIWLVLGLLLGPIPLLLMACLSDNRRRRSCPYCAESILPAAIVCRHCGRDLEATDIRPAPTS